MYTVIRFTALPGGFAAWEDLGRRLSAAVPEAPAGLRHRGEGVAIELCEGDGWRTHRDAVSAYVRAVRPTIDDARRSGVEVEVDVAVEPAEIEGAAFLSVGVDPELSTQLGAAGVTFVVTVYEGPNATDSRA